MGKLKATITNKELRENLRAMFDAIVDYFNNLVQTRFTIAGLYLAATGFLANSWFSQPTHQGPVILIPYLGIVITIACWGMEIRTRQLIDNLSRKGDEIEKLLGSPQGFFELMGSQPYPIIPPFGIKLSSEILEFPLIKTFISHSFGLNLLYAAILIFWFLALLLR